MADIETGTVYIALLGAENLSKKDILGRSATGWAKYHPAEQDGISHPLYPSVMVAQTVFPPQKRAPYQARVTRTFSLVRRASDWKR